VTEKREKKTLNFSDKFKKLKKIGQLEKEGTIVLRRG